MKNLNITPADLDLVQQAKTIISQRYKEDYHHVGCAVRATTGEVITGVHVEANVGRITICGEAVAIGRAITEGFPQLDTIVAVRRDDDDPDIFYVVSPCGMCREMINDYMPNGFCICIEEGKLKKVPASDLLPGKYVREACVPV